MPDARPAPGAASEASRLRLVADFLEAASRTPDDELAVFQALTERAGQDPGRSCGVCRLLPDEDHYAVVAYHAADPARLASVRARVLNRPLRLDESGFGAMLAADDSLLLATPEAVLGSLRYLTDDLREHMRANPTPGQLWVPVRIDGRVVGAVNLNHTDDAGPPLTDADQRFCEALAAGASLLLEAAAATRAERRRARHADLVAAFFAAVAAAEQPEEVYQALVEQVLSAVRGGVIVYRVDGDEMPLVVAEPPESLVARVAQTVDQRGLRVGEGVSGRVAETGEPYFKARYTAQELRTYRASLPDDLRTLVGDRLPPAAIAVPLRTHGRVSGVLFGSRDYDDTEPFDEADFAFVKALAERATVALEAVDARDQRRQLEDELVQAQKMETIGRLAGGVAHDFNNILTGVIGYASLGREISTEPEVQEALRTIQLAAERAAGLTHQLLAFSRRQMLDPSVVDLNGVVNAIAPMLRRIIGEDVELSVDCRADGCVLADRTQLEQVVLNLAVNGRDAMPDGGRLLVSTEVVHFVEAPAHVDMPPGEYVVLAVTDTGTGIDEETRKHLFEPFFTTKGVGQGTGLGLATVYGIVRQSLGHIYVYSEPGLGTTFRIYLPRVAGMPVETPAEEPAVPAGSGRILLVEDEDLLRQLGTSVLERAGYEVLAAATPAEALAAAAATEPFDLLASDVIMPGMTGVNLARTLRQVRPGLAVLLMSGYAEDFADATGVADTFLAKPFTPTTMLRAVREAFAARQAIRSGGPRSG